MPANFWKMAIAGHAKGVAIPICGSGLPSAFATGYGGTSLMASGDGGKVVFENDEDRKGFLFRLAKVCVSHGWRVHAWVLMRQLEKVLVAALLRERTAVVNPWIAQRLVMGHSGSVSRLVVACGKSVTQTRELEKLEKMLKCDI
jgi:hypothetical protein